MLFNKDADIAFNELASIDNGCNVYSHTSSSYYMYENSYRSYIDDKINNERAILSELAAYIPVKESTILLEAKFTDTLKAKFNKALEFIKGLIAKFLESMNAFFLDNKDYLEKYKDIILKKKPKEDLEFAYNGNYDIAIKRLIDTELPLFNAGTHLPLLQQDGDAPIIKNIMQTSGNGNYNVDADEKPSEIFKEFFTGADQGKTEGKFTDLNFTDLYNFCYNVGDMKKVVDKDRTHLEQSTNTIIKALEEELSKADNTAQTGGGGATTTPPTTGAQQANASAIISTSGHAVMEMTPDAIKQQAAEQKAKKQEEEKAKQEEAKKDEANKAAQQQSQQPSQQNTTDPTDTNGKTNLQIKGSNAAKQTGSYDRSDPDAVNKAADEARGTDKNVVNGEDNNQKINNLNKSADKWKTVCNSFISAKLTAYEQIAKDYMEIIRAHVRSYGGQDLKNKETDKAKQQGSTYQKTREANQQQQQQTGNENAGNAQGGGA